MSSKFYTLSPLKRDVIIYGLLNIIRAIVPFLMLPFLTSNLNPEQYGTLSLIEVSILFLAPFLLTGAVNMISSEYVKLASSKLSILIVDILKLNLILTVLCTTLLMSVLFMHWPDIGVSKNIIILFPIFVFLRVPFTIYLTYLQVSRNIRYFCLFTLMQVLVELTLTYLFVSNNFGFEGRILSVYSSLLFVSIFSLIMMRSDGLLGFKSLMSFRIHNLRSIFTYSIPLIPHVLSGLIISYSDRFFLAFFLGQDTVASYAVAFQLSTIIVLIAVSINQAWMPHFFRLLKENKKTNKKILVPKSFFAFLFFFSSAILVISREYTYSILVDERYYASLEYFPLLVFGSLFQALYMLLSLFFFYNKKTGLLAKITLTCSALNIVLNYFLAVSMAAYGVALATALSWFLFFVLTSIFLFIENKRSCRYVYK